MAMLRVHVLLESLSWQLRLTMRALVIVKSGAFCEGWKWGVLGGGRGEVGCGEIFTCGDMHLMISERIHIE